MKSNKQRREELTAKRESGKEAARRNYIITRIGQVAMIPVDKTKVFSRSRLPQIPDFYKDRVFKCRTCEKEEVWTARQQQWWYEVAKGQIESRAVLCKGCRRKEKARKEDARRTHLDGLAKKKKSETRV